MNFKKIILAFIFSFAGWTIASAQTADGADEGKTYYDSGKTIVKEVFHYIFKFRYFVSPETGEKVVDPNPKIVRHGAYVMYRKDGTLQESGQYDNGRKVGVWKYYDSTGTRVISEENFGT